MEKQSYEGAGEYSKRKNNRRDAHYTAIALFVLVCLFVVVFY